MKIKRNQKGQFIKGHNVPKEFIEKCKEKNKGKRYSIKTEFKKGEHRSPETEFKKGQISNWKGKYPSKKTLDKMKKSHIGQVAWNKNKTGIYSKKTRQKMSIAHIKYMTSGKMIYKETSIEIAIERELIKRHIYYDKQVPIFIAHTVVYFLLPNKIIIYCDGDYWHNLPNNKNRDINQDFILTFNGYKVYRFMETEIKKSAKNCVDKIICDILNNKYK